MQTLKFPAILILVALLVIFGSLNMGEVPLELGFSTHSLPLFFLILSAMIAGAFMVWISQTIAQARLKRHIRLLNRRIQELEPQLPAFPAPLAVASQEGTGEDT